MIVALAIDPESIAELSAVLPSRAATALHNRVIESLMPHGTFVFFSPEEASAMVRFVKASDLLAQADRKRWQSLIEFLYMRRRFFVATDAPRLPLKQLDDPERLADYELEGSRSIVVLKSEHFEQLFQNDSDSVEHVSGGVTATTSLSVVESSTMRTLVDLAASGRHPTGATRDRVFSDLFEPLCSRDTRVSVVDRYLFKEIAYRDESRRRNNPPEHLSWLLSRLDETALEGTRVALLGGYEQGGCVPDDAQEMLDILLRYWSPVGRIQEIELVLASGRDFPHSRHVRFGGPGFFLDEGFDRLRKPQLWAADGIMWKYCWSEPDHHEMVGRETRVREASSASVARWVAH